MGDATNKNTYVSDTGFTKGSNLMIVTKDPADGFVQIDKATEDLQLQFPKLDITEDVNMEVNMVDIS